eukprot:1177574-Prorocentrum_minimum.AAC.6
MSRSRWDGPAGERKRNDFDAASSRVSTRAAEDTPRTRLRASREEASSEGWRAIQRTTRDTSKIGGLRTLSLRRW